MMGNVYRNTETVIVWLGQAIVSTRNALRFLAKRLALRDQPSTDGSMNVNDEVEWVYGGRGQKFGGYRAQPL
jgi:hypothetical protein